MEIFGWSDKYEQFFAKTVDGMSYLGASDEDRLQRVIRKLDDSFKNTYQ